MGYLPMKTSLLLLALASAPPSLPAATPPASDPAIDPTILRAGFLSGHPDMRYRLLGLRERNQDQHADALRFFMRASYYGDKPSQGMVAEMLWNGQGTAQDRALAYAWMDLASERGYSGFLAIRERYWAALSEAERQRAVREGEAIYARYGDAAAQPRLDAELRRARRNVTGSRTGFTGNVQIHVPGPGGTEQIDGSKFHDPKYWDPKQYRAWQDGIWMQPRMGRVSVGEVEKIDARPPASRLPATAPEQGTQEPQTPTRDESDLGTDRPDQAKPARP